MDGSIRPALPSDWPGVAAVLAELGRPDARGTPEEADHREIFVAYLERDDVEAFVAEAEGEILGFVNIEFRRRLNREPPEGWVAELVVRKDKRGGSIGKRLLDRVEGAARERGCRLLALESATWRQDAHRFYEREGWTHAAKAFVKDLGT